jgi:hypothetical protein
MKIATYFPAENENVDRLKRLQERLQEINRETEAHWLELKEIIKERKLPKAA